MRGLGKSFSYLLVQLLVALAAYRMIINRIQSETPKPPTPQIKYAPGILSSSWKPRNHLLIIVFLSFWFTNSSPHSLYTMKWLSLSWELARDHIDEEIHCHVAPGIFLETHVQDKLLFCRGRRYFSQHTWHFFPLPASSERPSGLMCLVFRATIVNTDWRVDPTGYRGTCAWVKYKEACAINLLD